MRAMVSLGMPQTRLTEISFDRGSWNAATSPRWGWPPLGESACGEDEIAFNQVWLHAVAGDVESTGTGKVEGGGRDSAKRGSPGPQFSLLHDCMRLGII